MKAYQLKVTLKDIKPPIWRRIVVPAGITFATLAEIVNEAMGWLGYHLYTFDFRTVGLSFVSGEPGDDWLDLAAGDLPASRHRIDTLLDETKSFSYVYDFSDWWAHTVLVEKIIPDYPANYPTVLKYKGEAPPEDCGGVTGYYALLAADGVGEDNEQQTYYEREPYDMEAVNAQLAQRFVVADKPPVGEKPGSRGKAQWIPAEYQQWAVVNAEPEVYSFHDVLVDMSKADLIEIAKWHGLSGYSTKTKNALAAFLTAELLDSTYFENYFSFLGNEEIAAVEAALAGSVMEGDYSFELDGMSGGGYCALNGFDQVVVSKEVRAAYAKINHELFHWARQRRSAVLICLRAVNTLYGAAPLTVVADLLRRYTGHEYLAEEIKKTAGQAPKGLKNFVIEDDWVIGSLLADKALREHVLHAQGDKPFCIPSAAAIRSQAYLGQWPDSPARQAFQQVLYQQCGLDMETAGRAAASAQSAIALGGEMQDVLAQLTTAGAVFGSRAQMETLVMAAQRLWNSTPTLLHRARTPNAIAQRPDGRQTGQSKNNITSVDFVRKTKIGRDDLCPCGSGKKYKQCCGQHL